MRPMKLARRTRTIEDRAINIMFRKFLCQTLFALIIESDNNILYGLGWFALLRDKTRKRKAINGGKAKMGLFRKSLAALIISVTGECLPIFISQTLPEG